MPSNHRVRDTHLPHIRLLLLAIRTICFTLFAGAMVIHEAMVPIVLLAFFAVLLKVVLRTPFARLCFRDTVFRTAVPDCIENVALCVGTTRIPAAVTAERWLALSLADTWEDGQAGESLFNFHCPFVCRRSRMLLFSNSLLVSSSSCSPERFSSCKRACSIFLVIPM